MTSALRVGPRTLAIIGSVGIPNRYGGPEAFAESISPEMIARGYRVLVTCDRGRYLDDLSRFSGGAERIFIRMPANGTLSPLHDLFAFLAVLRRSHVILVLGVSGGLFFPVFRLMCALAGARLVVNIDGIEWRRDKFGVFEKCVLFVSDWLAQRFAHGIVYDNAGLLDFVLWKGKAACVEYSGELAISPSSRWRPPDEAVDYVLTVCRIEPENNCELLIDGFLQSARRRYVFVGNWSRSEYGRQIRRKYQGEGRLELRDPVYDPDALYRLRKECSTYLHGHSVGGTNPSLVEILYFDCDIFCWDCVFNKVTAGETARFFSSAAELGRLLDEGRGAALDRTDVRRRYSNRVIADKLEVAITE